MDTHGSGIHLILRLNPLHADKGKQGSKPGLLVPASPARANQAIRLRVESGVDDRGIMADARVRNGK